MNSMAEYANEQRYEYNKEAVREFLTTLNIVVPDKDIEKLLHGESISYDDYTIDLSGMGLDK